MNEATWREDKGRKAKTSILGTLIFKDRNKKRHQSEVRDSKSSTRKERISQKYVFESTKHETVQ